MGGRVITSIDSGTVIPRSVLHEAGPVRYPSNPCVRRCEEMQEGETQGAMSAIAMALTAVFTAFVGPFLIPWLVGIGQ